MNKDIRKLLTWKKIILIFSLFLFIIIMLLIYIQRAQKRSAINWVKSKGGQVESYYPDWVIKKTSFLRPAFEVLIGKRVMIAELDGSDVKDLKMLECCYYLRSIYLQDSQISDISSMVNFKNLEELYLSNTKINDFNKLNSLQNLRFLELSGIPLIYRRKDKT